MIFQKSEIIALFYINDQTYFRDDNVRGLEILYLKYAKLRSKTIVMIMMGLGIISGPRK